MVLCLQPSGLLCPANLKLCDSRRRKPISICTASGTEWAAAEKHLVITDRDLKVSSVSLSTRHLEQPNRKN